MKFKKLVALLTATTLVAFPTATAFADQTDLTGVSVESDATVNYIDPSGVIKITVPTSSSLSFTLDPQNLAATQGVGDWDPTSGGTVLPIAVATVVNKSAIPVKTSVAFSITDDATTKTTLVDSDATINDGTDRKMHLTITPANAKTSVVVNEIAATTAPAFVQNAEGDADAIFTKTELDAAGVTGLLAYSASGSAIFGKFVCTNDSVTGSAITYNQVEVPAIPTKLDATTATTVSQFNATTGGLASTANATTVTDTGANLIYIINKAQYYVSKNGSAFELKYRGADTVTNYDTASFIIGGTINKNANWSAYTGLTKISLSATYSFEAMTETTASAATKLADSYNSVAYVAPVAPTIADVEYALEAGTAVDVTVNLGAGASVATGITSITYDNAGTPETLTVTDDYALTGNTLQFTAAYIDEQIAANVTSGVYTVTFNNTPATTVDVTFTYTAPVAPTIADVEYALEDGTAVDVTVNLGAGASVATGITSITYDNAGTTETLTVTDDYTLTGTTLQFTAAYIDEQIAANVASRVYTVTFNNSAPATTVDVTLTYTAPGVAPTYFGATTKALTLNSTTFSLPFDLGVAPQAVTITSIALNVPATTDTYVPVYTYDADAGSMTFTDTDAFISYLLKHAANGNTIKVTTSDNTVSTITINVQ